MPSDTPDSDPDPDPSGRTARDRDRSPVGGRDAGGSDGVADRPDACPGCGLDEHHAVVAECWRGLRERGRLDDLWRTAPDDPKALAPVGADLPTGRALGWLRDRGFAVWPLSGTPPDGTTVPDPGGDGFYARAGAVERLRRRFHRGPIADAAVVEPLARVEGWLAVARSLAEGTLVPRERLDGRADPDVRVFELVDPPSGADPADLVADRLLVQRTGTACSDVLFAHDGWTGERVAVAPDPGTVPRGVEGRLKAEIATDLL